MFHISSYFIHPLANVWQIVNIVPLSTGCAGNLNRKARIAKVRFLTAVHGTSWQSIVDGPRWKRALSYHELYELKFAPNWFYKGHLSRETGLLSTGFRFRKWPTQICNQWLPHPRRPGGGQSGREKRRDESFQAQADHSNTHRTISNQSNECWLLIGHKKSVKKCFVLLCRIDEPHLLSSFREFVYDGYYLATVARFVHQAFLTRNEGTTDESKNVLDAISRSNSTRTEINLFLTDHNVS